MAAGAPASGPDGGTITAFQERLVQCCIKIWGVVKDTLCHDSPEGHDPSGPAGSEDADVKGMLSFSFRACHESRYVRDAMLIRLF